MGYNSKNYKRTICWNCKKAAGRCSWSRKLIPVEGWVAEETIINISKNHPIKSYLVIKCPQFEGDEMRT